MRVLVVYMVVKKEGYELISLDTLEHKLKTAPPNNVDRSDGYALINVLAGEVFERQHIPGSINIPTDDEGRFEALFDAGKEIIVYGDSSESDASSKVAARLARRGFRNIEDYAGGLREWKAGRHAVSGTDA